MYKDARKKERNGKIGGEGGGRMGGRGLQGWICFHLSGRYSREWSECIRVNGTNAFACME